MTGPRFPANLNALHRPPAWREWLVICAEWIWVVAAGVSGPNVDEKGVDPVRVSFSAFMATFLRAPPIIRQPVKLVP